VAESLLDALLEQFFGEGGAGECGGMGVRVLLPVAAGARPVIDRGLRERGVVVDRVEAYRTVGDESGLEVLLPCLRSGEIDVLTFTSPSAVDYFVAGARDRAVGESLEDVVGGAVIASIGPVTSSAVRGYGLDVRVEAQEYTVRGLLEALAEYYR
jgi:uroporphyrinogen III methyltransferase/synthase